MSLDEVMDNDGELFVNTDDRGEVIKYIPRGGVVKPINATVFREGQTTREGVSTGSARRFEIEIRNNATYGRTKIDTRGDKVKFPKRIGEVDKTWNVVQVLSHDAAMWRLEVG